MHKDHQLVWQRPAVGNHAAVHWPTRPPLRARAASCESRSWDTQKRRATADVGDIWATLPKERRGGGRREGRQGSAPKRGRPGHCLPRVGPLDGWSRHEGDVEGGSPPLTTRLGWGGPDGRPRPQCWHASPPPDGPTRAPPRVSGRDSSRGQPVGFLLRNLPRRYGLEMQARRIPWPCRED